MEYCVQRRDAGSLHHIREETHKEITQSMLQYYNAVQEFATYLSRYKLFKIMHDFNVERNIALELLKALILDGDDGFSCQKFINELNKIMAYVFQSYQLIVAQSGLFVRFDITSSPIDDDDDNKIRNPKIVLRFQQYWERSITLLPANSEKRKHLSQKSTDKVTAALEGMNKSLESRGHKSPEEYLNDELSQFFKELREVRVFYVENRNTAVDVRLKL